MVAGTAGSGREAGGRLRQEFSFVSSYRVRFNYHHVGTAESFVRVGAPVYVCVGTLLCFH